MKLSTKGRYGLRLMIELADSAGNGPVFLKDIAKRQEISEKYLWQLARALVNARLVSSLRGSRGGYMLARPSSEITLKDIITALEGEIALVHCVNDPFRCKRAEMCASREVWKKISEVISDTMEKMTLLDITKKHNGKLSSLTFAI